MNVGQLATIGVIAIAAFAQGCSSNGDVASPSSTEPPKPLLDGTYHVEIDGQRTLRDGGPSPEASTSLQWAFRSACEADACIAVAVPVNDENPPKTGEAAVWDYGDGRWVKTVAGQLACGDEQAPTIETWALRPAGDETFTGTRHLASFGGDCTSVVEQFVTVSRAGDVNPAVVIPAPGGQAPLHPSEGAELRGRYNKTQTRQGQPATPPVALDVMTNCVRNTELCLTYTVYEPTDKPRRVLGYQLRDGRWTSAVPYDQTCPDGSPVRITVETEWPMPQRRPDPGEPIAELLGTQRDVYAEPCVKTIESQLTLERIGN
jgi:hypothetical protein